MGRQGVTSGEVITLKNDSANESSTGEKKADTHACIYTPITTGPHTYTHSHSHTYIVCVCFIPRLPVLSERVTLSFMHISLSSSEKLRK